MQSKKGWSPSIGEIERTKRNGNDVFKLKNIKAMTPQEYADYIIKKIITAFKNKKQKKYQNITSLLIYMDKKMTASEFKFEYFVYNKFKQFVSKNGKGAFKYIILIIKNDFCKKF